MPVVVTGADGPIGRALIPMLIERGSEVRAHVPERRVAEALRRPGVKVAVGEPTDAELLTTVMSDAHTVCHLPAPAVSDSSGEEAVLDAARSALEAAREAGVSRVLFVSWPGASAGAANAILRVAGAVEDEIRSTGIQHVILRCTHLVGPGTFWVRAVGALARARVATVVGPGTQRVAPVYVEDVARALAAADDRASVASGTFGLQGPDEVTADEVVALLAGGRRRALHLPPAAARRAVRSLRRLSPAFLDLMARDCLADAPDAAAEFGVRLTPLREALARSVE